MNLSSNSRFQSIESKVLEGTPLSQSDGIELLLHPNYVEVAALAHGVRTTLHGADTYYNWNLHLNVTNVCKSDCLFCSFARLKTGMPEAYTMSLSQAEEWIEKRFRPGMTEIHIVNGNNPDLPFEYYESLLQLIRKCFPDLHIKAFTAVEIHHFHELYGMSYQEILSRLIASGLGSLPGGGAEIFAPRARKKICRDKATADEWLEVHRVAHTLGLKSNCTILFGTIERPDEVIDHFIRLRDLQAETGGLQTFIPLAFHPDGNRMKNLPGPTAAEALRIISVSRLMLNNIPHIKAYWVMLGISTAQMALLCGANDFDGTVTEEKIYHMAGSSSPQSLTIAQIRDLIERAGMVPVERTTTYERVERGTASRPLEALAIS